MLVASYTFVEFYFKQTKIKMKNNFTIKRAFIRVEHHSSSLSMCFYGEMATSEPGVYQMTCVCSAETKITKQ